MSTDNDKPQQNRISKAKKLRNEKIIAMSLEGKKTIEIAKELGIDRTVVSKALNGPEIKEKIKEAESRLAGMMEDALQGMHELICDKSQPATRFAAIRALLKNFGSLKESVDISHTFPKPTVIEWNDGTKTMLGTEADKEESDNEN